MQIIKFDGDNFAMALSNPYTPPELIRSKGHFGYFSEYLTDLKAQYMVVEEKYISKDFLHDFVSYYALCYKDYSKYCKRIHFFNTTLTEELVRNALLDKLDTSADFWKTYLGFIVVKPIPTTIIGYTVLKNYNSTNDLPDRHFWGLRTYKVHIFGHEIEVESLAFQEQDSVLAACATTAIWSMLNKAAVDFHTVLKSPSQITRDAGNVSPDGSRLFPNQGLSVSQICQAIFNSGLVSEVKQPDFWDQDKDGNIIRYLTNSYTRKIINAYSRIGIPIILVIEVPDGGGHGSHAITVSGFKQIPLGPVDPSPEIGWRSDGIEKLYAHDDQFGPFVRVALKDEMDLITPWTEQHAKNLPTRVTNIIVSVYPKIRISFEDIQALVVGMDTILTLFFDGKILYDLIWDIRINFSETFKSDLRTSPLDDDSKILLLEKSLPKYLWVATCYIGKFQAFVFTFDATDVISGMIAQDLICYLPAEIKTILHEFLAKNKLNLENSFSSKASMSYYQFLLNKLADGPAI